MSNTARKNLRVVVLTRDWRGNYENTKAAKGMILLAGEDEIDTQEEENYAMVFVNKKTRRSAQKLYELWWDVQTDEHYEGAKVIDDDTIEIKEWHEE